MTSTPSPSDPAAVAVELECLRRSIDVGFTRTDGPLSLLVQRHDQTDHHLGEHDSQLAEHDRRLDTLERGETERQNRHTGRLDALESARWPVRSVLALVAAAGLALSLWQYATQ